MLDGRFLFSQHVFKELGEQLRFSVVIVVVSGGGVLTSSPPVETLRAMVGA